jgi:hypothetical protein
MMMKMMIRISFNFDKFTYDIVTRVNHSNSTQLFLIANNFQIYLKIIMIKYTNNTPSTPRAYWFTEPAKKEGSTNILAFS